MLKLPTTVQLPFQALVDDGLKDAERLTLAVLYAYADRHGRVEETPMTLEAARAVGANSVRRHLYRLAEMNYVRQLNRPTLLIDPLRAKIAGYMLTLKPDGTRYPLAQMKKRIGSRNWSRKKRWNV